MNTRKIILALALLFSLVRMGWSQDGSYIPERTDPAKYVQMYPNPATDYLTVKLEAPHSKTVKLSLHSIIGNRLEVETEIVDDFELRLRVKDLPVGYYFLAVKDDESNFKTSYKFLKR